MTSEVAQIQNIRAQTLSLLEQLRKDPKPSYAIDGQTVSWQQYADSLQATVDWCDQKLNEAEPYEFRSRGVS